VIQVVRAVFPELNAKLDQLPDPRRQDMCRYSGGHIWWTIAGTYFFRAGSRNAFDEKRNAGQAPWNLGELCGQTGEDPRFAGAPTVTCSDNAALHAGRVDPEEVRQIPWWMIRQLLKRRLFDRVRLFDHWLVVLVDGSVQEKCRAGFEQAGKASSGEARYRYVLQAVLLGPEGTAFPLLHESVDLHDPVADKEDCELNAFLRLSERLKKEFPRLAFCWVGDALYSCQAVVERCQQYDWKYVLTLKEGRQPTTWDQLIKLLPLSRDNALRTCIGPGGQDGRLDYRWVEDLPLGQGKTNAILAGEITAKAATLYAFMTNFSQLTPGRVIAITRIGRERHRIEDTFNAEKNNGIGLEHVFCAETTASKNYYTMMQVAQILWILVCHGYLKRVYQWARKATEQGLARAVWEGLRPRRLPPDVPPLGQLRFSYP
jgi:hypothetical protein